MLRNKGVSLHADFRNSALTDSRSVSLPYCYHPQTRFHKMTVTEKKASPSDIALLLFIFRVLITLYYPHRRWPNICAANLCPRPQDGPMTRHAGSPVVIVYLFFDIFLKPPSLSPPRLVVFLFSGAGGMGFIMAATAEKSS